MRNASQTKNYTMEKAILGREKCEVARLCVGTWQAAGWAASDDIKMDALYKLALESGLNFFDTAEGYGDGHSEKILGLALKGRRDKAIISTKFSHKNSAPAKIRKSLEGSLKRLRTDYVDLYQQHWPPKSPPLEESLAELEKLKTEGKIRFVGVSNWMEPEWSEINNPSRVDCLQPCYSLLWRSIERKVLPLCREHKISIIPYSPLCQGVLAGRFRGEEKVPTDPRKNNWILGDGVLPSLSPFLETLKNIAEKYSKTMAQVSLRWLLDIEGVTAPIVGITNESQLKENLGALSWNLDTKDWQTLSDASASFSSNLKPHDTLWRWHSRG